VGNKTVLILGCSSDIGVQGVRIFLEKKFEATDETGFIGNHLV